MNLKIVRLDYTTLNFNSVQEVLENAQDYLMKVSGEVAGPHDGEEVFKALPENFDRELKHVLGVYQENVMIGVIDCFIGFPDANKSHIGLLLLSERVQRKGMGTLVYSKLEEYLSQFSSIDTIRLSVVETNHSVTRFWEKCGFGKTGIVKPYTNKKVVSRAIIMEKPFGKHRKPHI